MQLSEVKNQFHSLIDEIENPTLLESFFNLFKARIREPESSIWNTLSDAEQSEVLDAFQESEAESNLLSNDKVKLKYKKWLKK